MLLEAAVEDRVVVEREEDHLVGRAEHTVDQAVVVHRMGGVVLAHLMEQVLQVERDRAVAPAVVGGGRAQDLIPKIRLQADRAGARRHAEVGRERLRVRVEVEDRVERGSLGEELLHERRRPLSIAGLGSGAVVRGTGTRDHDQLLGHRAEDR